MRDIEKHVLDDFFLFHRNGAKSFILNHSWDFWIIDHPNAPENVVKRSEKGFSEWEKKGSMFSRRNMPFFPSDSL